MINNLIELLSYDFFLYGLLTVILIAPLTGSMGIMVTQGKMSFFSDAISHSLFTGLAFAVLFKLATFPTLIVFAILISIAITFVRRKTKQSSDTVIGSFFTTSVALGIVIIYLARKFGGVNVPSVEGFLFGDILSVSKNDLKLFSMSGVFTFLAISILHNKFMFCISTPEIAKSRGINVKFYDYLFSIVLSLVVVIGVKAMGVLMINAMLIIPAATSKNIAKSHKTSFWSAIIIGLISGVIGLIGSYYLDIPSGAAIVLLLALSFFVSLVFTKD